MWLVRMIYSDAERLMHFCEEEKESRKKRMGERDLTKLASQINLGGLATVICICRVCRAAVILSLVPASAFTTASTTTNTSAASNAPPAVQKL